MVGRIYHVGLTVSDLERSIAFYRDVLGLEFQGEIFMEGEETDKMFRRVNCKARVAYLNGSKAVAVSYTHLDVYKRQTYWSAWYIPKEMPSGCSAVTSVPVMRPPPISTFWKVGTFSAPDSSAAYPM